MVFIEGSAAGVECSSRRDIEGGGEISVSVERDLAAAIDLQSTLDGDRLAAVDLQLCVREKFDGHATGDCQRRVDFVGVRRVVSDA